MRRPCENCPWRKDVPLNEWPDERLIALYQSCQHDGMSTFACHKTHGNKTRACQGWVRVLGYEAIGVRLGVIQGTITNEEVEDKKGPELYESFEAMMEANGIEIPRRNRRLLED